MPEHLKWEIDEIGCRENWFWMSFCWGSNNEVDNETIKCAKNDPRVKMRQKSNGVLCKKEIKSSMMDWVSKANDIWMSYECIFNDSTIIGMSHCKENFNLSTLQTRTLFFECYLIWHFLLDFCYVLWRALDDFCCQTGSVLTS